MKPKNKQDIEYFNTLVQYCYQHSLQHPITCDHHMFAIKDSNRGIICHYYKENGKYIFDSCKEYLLQEALEIFNNICTKAYCTLKNKEIICNLNNSQTQLTKNLQR